MKRLKNWNGVIDPRGRDTNDTKADTNDTKVDTADTNDTKKAILNIIQNDSSVTQKNIGKKLGISIAAVKRIMRSLQKSDRIQREDSRRNSLWTVINSKRCLNMAASSITKNFVISDKDDVEAFADALEKAANTDYPPIPTLGRQVTDPKEIKALMIRLKEKKMNG